ncbi:MAG TPA: alpha/beta fold hydrolase [Solirubrobacteraceae bacterium]|jgi:pimeloyl-ACP methyl ester carboxylesterase
METSSGPERRVDVGGGELRVLDEGTGQPVLLLHGFPDRADMWRHVAGRLREGGRRTLSLDLPGFGESSAPAGRANYRAAHVLEQIEQLLPALGIDGPVDVIGHDWGAYLSWYMVLTRPDLVRRHVALSVGHPRAFVLSGWEQKRKSRYMLLFVIPDLAERVMAAGGFRRVRKFIGDSHPDIDTVVADLSRPGRLTAGLNWYRANFFSTPLRRWPRCRVPTLGILPTEDDYLAEDQMINTRRYMDADWRYERLPGFGHWAPLQAPEQVAGLSLDWLGAGAASGS